MNYEERLEALENKGKRHHLNYSRNFLGFGVRRPVRYFFTVLRDKQNDFAMLLILTPLMCWYKTSRIVAMLYFLIKFDFY